MNKINNTKDSIDWFKFFYGIGVPTNREKAKEICLEGSLKGSKVCEAIQYFYGWGVKNNEKKAFEMLEEIIKKDVLFEQKDIDICYHHLALSYQYGFGVEHNINKAIKFYKQSAELGNSRAMKTLAFIFEFGYGIEKDTNKATELYKKAEELEIKNQEKSCEKLKNML